jgi:hypothetical protein
MMHTARGPDGVATPVGCSMMGGAGQVDAGIIMHVLAPPLSLHCMVCPALTMSSCSGSNSILLGFGALSCSGCAGGLARAIAIKTVSGIALFIISFLLVLFSLRQSLYGLERGVGLLWAHLRVAGADSPLSPCLRLLAPPSTSRRPRIPASPGFTRARRRKTKRRRRALE